MENIADIKLAERCRIGREENYYNTTIFHLEVFYPNHDNQNNSF